MTPQEHVCFILNWGQLPRHSLQFWVKSIKLDDLNRYISKVRIYSIEDVHSHPSCAIAFFVFSITGYIHSLRLSSWSGLSLLYKMRGLLLLSCLLAGVVNTTVIAKRSVGASTPLSSKSKICNVLDYGGIADGKTDVSTAIKSAFTKCVSGSAATLYVPAGKYSCMVAFQSNLAISGSSI